MAVDAESGAHPDFDEATTVDGGDGAYTATLSPAYRSSVGPFGGYLAAIALRAAATNASMPRLASLSCHFHAVAEPDAVRIEVSTVHATRRAESISVRMCQGDLPVLSALVWFVAERDGLDHDPPRVPRVPPPSLLAPLERVHAKFSGFWFAEARPIYEPPLSQPWPPGDPPWGLTTSLDCLIAESAPSLRTWMRMRPNATYSEPIVDASRALVAIDWLVPFVAAARHIGRRVVLHSTLDLNVSFHDFEPRSEWLYCEAEVGSARGGIAHGTATVWSASGVLLATGSQQMVQRIRL